MDVGEQGDRITVRIGGGVSGQVAAGHDIRQTYVRTEAPAVTAADREAVLRLVEELKAKVAAQAPPEQRDAALERVDELGNAVIEEKPDLTTMDYVRKWFGKHLPKLAGAVTGLIINPVVGKVVEAAGDLVAAEFRQLFGGSRQ